jgi:hypothetical protein
MGRSTKETEKVVFNSSKASICSKREFTKKKEKHSYVLS